MVRSARTLCDPNAPNDPAVEAAFQAVPETIELSLAVLWES